MCLCEGKLCMVLINSDVTALHAVHCGTILKNWFT